MTIDQQFIQDEVCLTKKLKYLVEIENQIQFAHIAEIFVQNFNENLEKFQDDELIVIFVSNGYKVQSSISFINYFVILVINKVAHSWFTGDD